jgi:hypothetical protein
MSRHFRRSDFMTKSRLTKINLERALLIEIWNSHGCEDVKSIEVEPFAKFNIPANWRVSAIHRTAGGIIGALPDEMRHTMNAIHAAEKKLQGMYSLSSEG